MLRPSSHITWQDPYGSEPDGWQGDLLLSGLFLAAATLVLAFIDPLHLGYQAQTVLSLLLAAIGSGVLLWAAVKGRLALYLLGASGFFALIALCLATQPVQLGTSLGSVLPTRSVLLLLVLGAWLFLLRPPLWARRAVVALGVPLLAILLVLGAPPVLAQVQGQTAPTTNFSPYWLAVDSRGTLYATNADGNSIWVFDRDGLPVGTIWPATASHPEDPGVGIVAVPQPTPVVQAFNPSGVPLPPPAGAAQITPLPNVLFCGIAVDHEDNLLVVNSQSQKLMKFDPAGLLVDQWPLPNLFDGSKGCVATDRQHIFLSSRFGNIYIMDRNARIEHEVQLNYQPFGIAPDRDGNLLVMGPFQMDRIDVGTGKTSAFTLPPPTRQLRIPYQALVVARNGEVLATDVGTNQIVRIAREGGRATGAIGDTGNLPGQFLGLGGIAEDADGRIYAADWQTGVVQRFTPRGRLEAVIWAHSPRVVVPVTEETE